ncbi:MAG TPA: O-antigen ligase family protein, partial [Gammaproteobacteria bacterium]
LLYAVPQARVRVRLDNALEQLRTYDYVSHSLQESPAPLCLDDPVLLRGWVAAGIRSPDPKLHVDVVSAAPDRAQQLTGKGCIRATVVQLVNDADHSNWLDLPHTVRKGQGASVVQLFIAGTGWVRFGKGEHAHLRVSRDDYRKSQLYTFPKDGTRLILVVPAHATLELVPLETYMGEYRDSLLESSVGQRLEMWAVAWRLFLQAPLTGTGTGDYMFGAQKLVDQGAALPVTAIYDHPHNEFLDALSSRGLVGLAALLLLFGVPAWLYARSLSSPDPARMGASLGGLLVCIGFPVFGLSETMLVHSVTLGWYVIMTAVFMATAERGNEVEGRGE